VFTACLATVVVLLRDVMFTGVASNAVESCLLLPSNRGIPRYITAAMVA
jgi:hypothetical protein